MKRGLKGILLVIALGLIIIIVRAMFPSTRQVSVADKAGYGLDREAIAAHLSGALSIKTISYNEPARIDREAFLSLHRYLERTYPLVHRAMKREVVNGLSLLYTWKGRNPSLKPVLFVSHLDVVPAESSEGTAWTYPPFSGSVKDGYVWGRGALDIKNGVISVLEAMEYLARKGKAPERTIYLAFGHDEEHGGQRGAAAMAALLESRGVRLACVLDEGGYILTGMIPGVKDPVALVGIAEKGYLTLRLSAQGKEGHSSMPSAHTSIGVLSRAICRLEESPFPGKLAGPTEDMFRYLGPEMPFGYRILFCNMAFFNPLISLVLKGAPSSAAMIRTTTAVTMIGAGTRENVLPGEAWSMVNFRIMPGETCDSVKERVREVIDDSDITITAMDNLQEPSPLSSADSKEFTALQRAVSRVCPGVITAPYLVVGGTDSRHYSAIADNVYRFLPARLGKEDMKRIHGADERIRMDNLEENVAFILAFLGELEGK